MVVSAPSPGKCVQNLEPIGVRGGPNVRVSVNYLESVVYRQNLDSRVVNRWGALFPVVPRLLFVVDGGGCEVLALGAHLGGVNRAGFAVR